MAKRKPQGLLKGALILSVAAILTRVLGGFFFKFPLQNLSLVASGYFSVAYNIYTPIYIVATAGLPTATARMVSAAISLKKFKDIDVINKVAVKLFTITGVIGMLVMIVAAFLYPRFVNQPITLTMLIMAPAILFCGLEGAYRGIYEGFQNMYPTAITQIIETVIKLALGLFLANFAYSYGISQFNAGLPVYGQVVNTLEEAKARTLPFISAGAMIGVTAGALMAIIYLMVRYRVKGSGVTKEELALSPPAAGKKEISKSLISFSIPIVLGTLATQITNLIDTIFLGKTIAVISEKHAGYFQTIYAQALEIGRRMGEESLNDILVGSREVAMTFVTLMPNVTMTLGISALPVLTAAWVERDRKRVRRNIVLVSRMTLLIALPSGIGLSVMARPLMESLYGKDSIAYLISSNQLQVLGIAVIFICFLAPIHSILQAMGRADIPAKVVVLGGVIKLILNIVLVNIPQLNLIGAAYSTILSYLVMTALSVIGLQKVAKMRIPWKKIVLGPLICSILCGLSAVVVNFLLYKVVSARIAMVSAILAAVLVYVFFLFFFNVVGKDDVLMLPKGEKIANVLEKRGWIR